MSQSSGPDSPAEGSSLFEPLKRLSMQSLIYGVGYVGTRIISFLLLPFYTHLITPTEYGEVTLLFIFIAVANVFYIYGFDIAFLRYYVMADSESERRRMYGATFFTQVITSVVFTAIILLAARPLVSLVFKNPVDILLKARLIRLCAGVLFLDCVAVFPFLVLRGRQQATVFTVLKLSNVLITILLNIWLVAVKHWGIEGIFWANLWTSVITTFAAIVVTVRYLVPAFSWDMLKKFAAFGFPNIPSLFFVMVIELSDRKILEVLRTTEEVGLYSTWYKMGLFMGIVANAFRFAWQPFFLDHAKKPNAEKTFAQVLTYYLWITAFLFLALIIFIKPLVQTRLPVLNSSLIDPSFWAGMGVFPVRAFGACLGWRLCQFPCRHLCQEKNLLSSIDHRHCGSAEFRWEFAIGADVGDVRRGLDYFPVVFGDDRDVVFPDSTSLSSVVRMESYCVDNCSGGRSVRRLLLIPQLCLVGSGIVVVGISCSALCGRFL